MLARNRTLLAWLLFAVTVGFLAAGLVVALLLVRPLTVGVLVQGAIEALVFRLSFATIGLVLTLRRPANPIGWLYAAAGLVWSLEVPGTPWVQQLVRAHRPLPPAAQVAAVVADVAWAPAVALGVTLPLLLLPDGRLRSARWRPVVAASLCGALLVVAGGLAPGSLTDPAIPTRSRWPAGPARRQRLPMPSAGCCMWQAWRRRWSAWCCGSAPPAGSSASSSAGSPPAPPPPSLGCWR